MKGLFLKYTDYNGKMDKFRIGSFMWEGSNKRYTLNEENSPEEDGSKFRFLKCKECGHHDFNEDAVGINEYACNGCEAIIEAVEYKG